MNFKKNILYTGIIGLIIIATSTVVCMLERTRIIHSEKKKITGMQPIKDLLDDVAGKLRTYKGWNVQIYSGTGCGKLYNDVAKTQFPSVFVYYQGSVTRDDSINRIYNFSVIVSLNDTDNSESSRLFLIDLMDKTIALLDEQKYKNISFKFKRDLPLEIPSVSVFAYEVTFSGEDTGRGE